MNKQILSWLMSAVTVHERKLKDKVERCQALQKNIGALQKLKSGRAPLIELELQYHLATLDWEVQATHGGKYETDVSGIHELVAQLLEPKKPVAPSVMPELSKTIIL